MSIPNLITLARLISVPLIIQLILTGSFGWAFVVFLLAGITIGCCPAAGNGDGPCG